MPNVKEYIEQKKTNKRVKKELKIQGQWEAVNQKKPQGKKDKKKLLGEMNRKIIRHRIFIALQMLGAVAVIAGGMFLLYLSNRSQVFTSYEILSSQERVDAVTAQYVQYANGMLKYSKDGAAYVNSANQTIWNQPYGMQNPLLDICNSYAAIADKNGSKIFVMNTTGLVGEIETLLPIQKIQVAGQGVVAAVLEDGTISKIHIYDKEGTQLVEMKASMQTSGFPVDVDISDDGIKLVVSHLQVSMENVKSTVAFYNLGSVGENAIDHYVSGYNYENTVFPKVEFISNNVAVAFGDNLLSVYEGSQKPVLKFEQPLEEEVQRVFSNDKYIGLIFKNMSSQEPYRMDIYNLKGDLVLSQPFGGDYQKIEIANDLVYMYNEMECVIYNLDGLEKFRDNFPTTVIDMIPLDSTKYILVTTNEIQVIRLVR